MKTLKFLFITVLLLFFLDAGFNAQAASSTFPIITATGGAVCQPGGLVTLCASSVETGIRYQWYYD